MPEGVIDRVWRGSLCERGGPKLVAYPPIGVEQMQSVEASMRLDAVASAGMGMSRGKVKDMIEGGDVLVNWKEVRPGKNGGCHAHESRLAHPPTHASLSSLALPTLASCVCVLLHKGDLRQRTAEGRGHRHGARQGAAGDRARREDLQGQVPRENV